MPSSSPVIERAQPLLGTYVAIRVRGPAPAAAHRAIDAAFEEIALVHDRMSFHNSDSDVARINRDAAARPVAVHPHTLAVLRQVLDIADRSGGVFDPTIAASLVRAGVLPCPRSRNEPDPEASWRDIDLAGGVVRVRRPLWIDLGGIAKGYAVDLAAARLADAGVAHAVINAGGDMRVIGADAERILLRTGTAGATAPVIELADGALASSSGRPYPRRSAPHVDPRRRRTAGTRRFVCVIAERCMIADALTKPALIGGRASSALLSDYGAVAYLNTAGGGWQSFGGAA